MTSVSADGGKGRHEGEGGKVKAGLWDCNPSTSEGRRMEREVDTLTCVIWSRGSEVRFLSIWLIREKVHLPFKVMHSKPSCQREGPPTI